MDVGDAVHSSVAAESGGLAPIAKAVALGVDAFPPAPVLNSPPTATQALAAGGFPGSPPNTTSTEEWTASATVTTFTTS